MTAPARRRVLPAGPRLQARAKADRVGRRRGAVRRASLLAAALVPVCLLSWLLLASPLLAVAHVQVTGIRLLPRADVLAAAGVREGTPLARVDTVGVRRRVAALAPVARVRVVRAWPGTLLVRVTERTAVASSRQGDGWVLVDGSGLRFSASAQAPAGLPELQGDAQAPAGPAVEVVAELPAGLRDQVATVALPSASSVVLGLRDGRTVVWGPPGQSARKAAVVAALLSRPGGTIDVTSPGLAVTR